MAARAPPNDGDSRPSANPAVPVPALPRPNAAAVVPPCRVALPLRVALSLPGGLCAGGAAGLAPGPAGLAPGAGPAGLAPGAAGLAPGAAGLAIGAGPAGLAPGAAGLAPGAAGLAPAAASARGDGRKADVGATGPSACRVTRGANAGFRKGAAWLGGGRAGAAAGAAAGVAGAGVAGAGVASAAAGAAAGWGAVAALVTDAAPFEATVARGGGARGLEAARGREGSAIRRDANGRGSTVLGGGDSTLANGSGFSSEPARESRTLEGGASNSTTDSAGPGGGAVELGAASALDTWITCPHLRHFIRTERPATFSSPIWYLALQLGQRNFIQPGARDSSDGSKRRIARG